MLVHQKYFLNYKKQENVGKVALAKANSPASLI